VFPKYFVRLNSTETKEKKNIDKTVCVRGEMGGMVLNLSLSLQTGSVYKV